MTSATLYREGDDLDALLAELDAQHPDRVRVVSISHPREGGVLGFFARQRVAVHYELQDERQHELQNQHGEPRSESRHDARDERDVPTTDGNAEFAAMLLEVAARKAALRARDELAATPAVSHPPLAPAVPPSSAGSVRDLLLGIGVPRRLLPAQDADLVDVAAAVRHIAGLLPSAPVPPDHDAAILAIVGPARDALAAARAVAEQLRLAPGRLWLAGVDSAPGGASLLADHWAAATMAADHRRAGFRPAVLAVATDGDVAAAARVVRAVSPDAVWAIADATRKTLDTRRYLARLGGAHALVVTGAADTASPASVLHLDVAVALLDGAPATPQRWGAVISDAVAGLTTGDA
jgi:hypothetical protein